VPGLTESDCVEIAGEERQPKKDCPKTNQSKQKQLAPEGTAPANRLLNNLWPDEPKTKAKLVPPRTNSDSTRPLEELLIVGNADRGNNQTCPEPALKFKEANSRQRPGLTKIDADLSKANENYRRKESNPK